MKARVVRRTCADGVQRYYVQTKGLVFWRDCRYPNNGKVVECDSQVDAERFVDVLKSSSRKSWSRDIVVARYKF